VPLYHDWRLQPRVHAQQVQARGRFRHVHSLRWWRSEP